jgi:hypothetical protein
VSQRSEEDRGTERDVVETINGVGPGSSSKATGLIISLNQRKPPPASFRGAPERRPDRDVINFIPVAVGGYAATAHDKKNGVQDYVEVEAK